MFRRGFALVELVLVVAIVALLMSLALPALVRVRNRAQEVVCSQNLRTLSVAWLMYKDDNDDLIVGGHVGQYPYDWVQGPMGIGTVIDRKKEGIRQGALFAYVGANSVDMYRCPADTRKLLETQQAFRSYSIAGGANGDGYNRTFVQITRYSEMQRPSERYVFVEEADRRGWNRNSWVLNPKGGSWVDPLAIWHSGGRSCLGFADGHTQTRRWVDASTAEMARRNETLQPAGEKEGEDLRFMLAGFPHVVDEGTP